MGRALAIAKGTVVGYVTAGLLGLAAAILLAVLLNFAGVTASIGLGPVPLLTVWSGPTVFGFSTEWGLWLVAVVGAVSGAVLTWRREPVAA
jgi:hypothetical protein